MLRIAHWIVTVLILLLGLTHIGIGFYCKMLSESTLWFIGSGFAIVFAGLFNVLAILTPVRTVRIMTSVANAVTAGLFVFAIQFVHGKQVYAGIALFFVAGLLTIFNQSVLAYHSK